VPQLCPSFALRFPPLCSRFAIVEAAHAEPAHTHTLSLSLSLSLHFLSLSAVVERLTIAARFTFRSIARSRIDMLWFYPLSRLPIPRTRVWTIRPSYSRHFGTICYIGESYVNTLRIHQTYFIWTFCIVLAMINLNLFIITYVNVVNPCNGHCQ